MYVMMSCPGYGSRKGNCGERRYQTICNECESLFASCEDCGTERNDRADYPRPHCPRCEFENCLVSEVLGA